MNARSCFIRALTSAIFIFTLTALSAAHAQQAAPPAAPQRSNTAKAAASNAEAVPIPTFDLASALMAESGGLTSDDAGRRARERAPQLVAAKALERAAEADVDMAWAAFLPQVQLEAQYRRIKYIDNSSAVTGFGNIGETFGPIFEQLGIEPPMTDAAPGLFNLPKHNYALSAGARWVISDVFLRAWPAYKAAVSMSDAQATETEVTEAAVELNARNAFYEYARALAEQAVAAQAFKQAEAQAAQIKLFVDAGTVAPVDLMTATARLEEMRSLQASAETRVTTAQNNLATLTGIPISEIKGLGEPVLERPAPPKASSEELVRQAFEHRAELRSLRKQVAANDYTHTAQRNAAFPQLVLSANDLHGRPNPRYFPPNTREFKNSWEVGVALAWSPNSTLTGYQAGRRADAQLHRARANLAAQEDAVRMEVVSAYQSYKAAEAVSAASEARLNAAEEAYRVRLAMYRVGAGVIVDLLNADLTVSQARLQRANAAINARAALAALRRAAAVDP